MAGDSGGDVACCLPTSLDEGRGRSPHLARVRGCGGDGSGRMCCGGGERQSSDGAMFGNGWLPNIEIINNQFSFVIKLLLIQLKFNGYCYNQIPVAFCSSESGGAFQYQFRSVKILPD